MNKLTKILLILLLIIIIVLLSYIMIYFMKNDFKNNTNVNLIESLETEIGSVDKINIDSSSTDIEIRQSNDDKILIQYYSNLDLEVKIENRSKCIVVDEYKEKSDKFFKNIFTNNIKKIIMYIPTAYTGEYDLKLKSGDIMSKIDLSNNKVNISSRSGDISINKAGEINVATSSGDITIYEISKKANISTSSGDIVINELNIDEDSNIETSSGDVIIRENKSNCYVETDTSSGDINVNKNDRKSDIILKIKTSSGDIKVY